MQEEGEETQHVGEYDISAERRPHLTVVGIESKQSQDAVQTDTFEDGIEAKAVPYSAMQFPLDKGPQGWKKRPRSPGLNWYKKYNTPESLKCGRVLVIDYVKQGRHQLLVIYVHIQDIESEWAVKAVINQLQIIAKRVCGRLLLKRSVR